VYGGIYPLFLADEVISGAPIIGGYLMKASVDSVAQLGDELSFTKGDLITVLNDIDSDWAYGRCSPA